MFVPLSVALLALPSLLNDCFLCRSSWLLTISIGIGETGRGAPGHPVQRVHPPHSPHAAAATGCCFGERKASIYRVEKAGSGAARWKFYTSRLINIWPSRAAFPWAQTTGIVGERIHIGLGDYDVFFTISLLLLPVQYRCLCFIIYHPQSDVVMIAVACVCKYFCNMTTFESLDQESLFLVCSFIFRNTGQVRIWRSSGQGQGHRRKKREIWFRHHNADMDSMGATAVTSSPFQSFRGAAKDW